MLLHAAFIGVGINWLGRDFVTKLVRAPPRQVLPVSFRGPLALLVPAQFLIRILDRGLGTKVSCVWPSKVMGRHGYRQLSVTGVAVPGAEYRQSFCRIAAPSHFFNYSILD